MKEVLKEKKNNKTKTSCVQFPLLLVNSSKRKLIEMANRRGTEK